LDQKLGRKIKRLGVKQSPFREALDNII